jgi:hypothetical protein
MSAVRSRNAVTTVAEFSTCVDAPDSLAAQNRFSFSASSSGVLISCWKATESVRRGTDNFVAFRKRGCCQQIAYDAADIVRLRTSRNLDQTRHRLCSRGEFVIRSCGSRYEDFMRVAEKHLSLACE